MPIIVIPAKAGIQGKGAANVAAPTLDPGFPLRSVRDDGGM